MRRSILCLGVLSVLLVTTSSVPAPAKAAKGKPVELPAEASLRDDPGDRVRSVGGPVYTPGVECVISWVDGGNGTFFLRTTGGACFGSSGEYHAVELDFGDPVTPISGSCEVDDPFGQAGTLSRCGTNTIPDLRILASDLFRTGASSTSVVLPFNLSPDFRNTAFQLEFEDPLAITDGDAQFRELTAAPGAVAELYAVRRGKKTSLGRFRMPFQLTVVLLP
jgi:hypothetical protein